MKIFYQGDLHLRDTRPVNRVDDYFSTQLKKFEQLLDAVGGNTLLIGGDLFDKPLVSPRLLSAVMQLLLSSNASVYSVFGQHDIPYHNPDVERSPLKVLELAGLLTLMINERWGIADGVCVCAASWEHEPAIPREGQTNILLGHLSVFGKVPHYWKGAGYTPDSLRETFPGYDFYLCGDIHTPLVDGNVVVSGSMLRQTIDQAAMLPRFYEIDTESGDVTPHYYDIEPDVFTDVEPVADGVDLTELVSAIATSSGQLTSFRDDSLALAGSDTEVKTNIGRIFDECS